MGPIAELLAGQGQQLGLAAGRGINADAGDDALQQCGVTVPEMAQQQVAQVALAVAMAQQQHRIGGLDRQGDLLEIGMVKGARCPAMSRSWRWLRFSPLAQRPWGRSTA